jgi:hypothetical protein
MVFQGSEAKDLILASQPQATRSGSRSQLFFVLEKSHTLDVFTIGNTIGNPAGLGLEGFNIKHSLVLLRELESRT